MTEKIAAILKKWVNLDFFRGSWARLACERAPIIFESLYAGSQPIQTAFTSAHYELTNRCNARCLHCQRWGWKDVTDPPLAETFSILQNLQDLGVETVTIGGGEPLLYPELAALISRGKAIGMQLGIITNGLYLTEELIQTFCDHVEWVRFSLDASNSATYEVIRGVPNGYERVVRNLKRLLVARRQRGSDTPQIGINFVIQASNYHLLPQVLHLAEENEVDTVLFKIVHGDGPYLLNNLELNKLRNLIERMLSSESYIPKTNLREFLVSITEEADSEDIISGYPLKSFYLKDKLRCFAPFFFLTLDSHGYCYPCDYLLFDTRDEIKYQKDRMLYTIGHLNEIKGNYSNSINKLHIILQKLSHVDPISLPECGCCTRFYRFNKLMNQLYSAYVQLRTSRNPHEVADLFLRAINSHKGRYGWL